MFDAISSTFPPFITILKQSWIYKFSYQKYLNIYEYKRDIISNDNAEGFHICVAEKIPIFIGSNMYKCAKGGYISSQFICDGNKDCPNDYSDETLYLCNTFPDSKPTCGSLHYLASNGECLKYTITEAAAEVFVKHLLICQNDTDLHSIFWNDLVADCGPEAEDEPELKSLFINGTITKCTKSFELPCRQGHSRCFNIIYLYLQIK